MTDLKDECPIVSYSIAKVIDKNSKQPIALADCSNLFTKNSLVMQQCSQIKRNISTNFLN